MKVCHAGNGGGALTRGAAETASSAGAPKTCSGWASTAMGAEIPAAGVPTCTGGRASLGASAGSAACPTSMVGA
eukprot:1860681-Lingulodinium_polyedra.AAC.1